ncbi:hypothetical protein Pan97_20820 [Bremerella volcania]|uniref:Sulfatase n=1 Tax=Bremerella volcania TaxID=2527984 RepID=A0A518C767_9BACT|nr:DUF1501 domain-containing protein [Bremerella volcania]QDU75061.1 hypothetical protein Pan97_20820 [Bremerella volcania]
MFHNSEAAIRQTRRTFLGQGMAGLGSAALATLMNASSARADDKPGPFPNFAPKAKRVIVLCQAGGPSHLETFDEKPELKRLNDQPMPESFTKGQPIAQLQGKALKCYAPRFDFKHYGNSGQTIASLFPKMGEIADDICIINSMVTEQINHDPAHTFMNTGTSISGRPSMGSWVQYGLGSEADDLPGFVVLTSIGKGGQAQPIAARQWHSGFLPSRYQGVEFRSAGDPVLYVNSPPGITTGRQQDVFDAVNQMNKLRQPALDDPEIATRIAQYELAFKMQTSVPSLMDISGEPQHILDMYGTQGADGTFAANCLLARRLAERGVRFVQLYHRGWDHHGGIERGMQICASEVDQASAALVTDLKHRGMLDDTLVVWGGEFGRTPMAQGSGRDHHIKGFSIWMAGGGIKGGIKHGKTDDLGYNAVEDIVHVHDFHATMLHLLGINHEKLTVRHQGRDFRLTDVHGHVVKDILA